MKTDQLGVNIASLAGYTLHDAISKLKTLGFKTVELLSFERGRHSQGDLPGFWFGKLSGPEKAELKEALRSFTGITLHAPFADTPLFTYNEFIKREVVRELQESIEAASYLGASLVTIHPNPKRSHRQEEYWDEMIDTFRSLGDYAAPLDVDIGIENMFSLDSKSLLTKGFPESPDDYIRLINEINHSAVGANVDVGHFFGYVEQVHRCTSEGVQRYNSILMKVVTELDGKLYHLHLHDMRETDWREHRAAVGEGIIDFERLFGFLRESRYSRLMTLELEEEDKESALIKSKEYLERLIRGES
jgi:sugar phosphate isomerase/epimerase